MLFRSIYLLVVARLFSLLVRYALYFSNNFSVIIFFIFFLISTLLFAHSKFVDAAQTQTCRVKDFSNPSLFILSLIFTINSCYYTICNKNFLIYYNLNQCKIAKTKPIILQTGKSGLTLISLLDIV